MSNNSDFKFAPVTGEAPLYFGYVLECDPSKPTSIDYGNGNFSSYQVDTKIYWTPGTYNGNARFTDLKGNARNEVFSITVLPKSNSQIITGFYQTKVATIEGDQVGFSISLGIPDDDVIKIVWMWDDKTSDSIYPFPNLPEAKNPWHLYACAGIFNGNVMVYRKDGTYDKREFSIVAAENPANHKDIAFTIQCDQILTTKGSIVNFSINSLGNFGVNVTHAWWYMGNGDSFNRAGSNALGLQYRYDEGTYKVTCNVCLSNGRCYWAVPCIISVNVS